MKNTAAKKAIASYYILSLLLTLPLLIPLWLIKEPFWVIVYLVCFLIYMRIAVNFAVRATVFSSLWKELDAEKYAAIIHAKPFWIHFSYKLNLYFAVGDYQAACDTVSSILLQHKNAYQRAYGHLLLCRICFERGDYEGLKEHLAEIDRYFKDNPSTKFPKPSRAAYEFYRAFSRCDYALSCAILEKSIEALATKKSLAYVRIIREYQLAVTKRMKGDVDEAKVLFEGIQEKAPKLVFSSLAQKQLAYLQGTLEEKAPEALKETTLAPLKAHNKARITVRVAYLIGILLLIGGIILLKLDHPTQENRDLEYESKIASTLHDEYEDYQIIGYFSVYPDDGTEAVDSVFLVESNGRIDLHTLYKQNEQSGNSLNVKDIRVDQPYAYENVFAKKIEFVLTEKKRSIPKNALGYYETDGYYFCVMRISDP